VEGNRLLTGGIRRELAGRLPQLQPCVTCPRTLHRKVYAAQHFRQTILFSVDVAPALIRLRVFSRMPTAP
jgi:hypothetical protein